MSTNVKPDFTYREDQLLPPLGFLWKTYNKTIINFASGYTFQFQLVRFDGSVVLTKTTGITGYGVDPNVVVEPDTGWWSGLGGARYMIHLTAIDVNGKSRIFRIEDPPTIEIFSAPT